MDARLYFAVVLQGGLIIVLLLEGIVFAILTTLQGKIWIAGMFGALPFFMGVGTVLAGRLNGLSLDQLRSPRLDPAVASGIDKYVNAIAGIDLLILGVLVLLTGGLTRSSFVSLLLLVPVLAILVRATQLRKIVISSNLIFLGLAVTRVPFVRE